MYHIDISKYLKCAFFNDKYIRRENNKRIPKGTESKFEKYVRETWWWETQKNWKTFGIHEIALWSVFLSRSSRGEKEVRTARMVRASHVSEYSNDEFLLLLLFMFLNSIFFFLWLSFIFLWSIKNVIFYNLEEKWKKSCNIFYNVVY